MAIELVRLRVSVKLPRKNNGISSNPENKRILIFEGSKASAKCLVGFDKSFVFCFSSFPPFFPAFLGPSRKSISEKNSAREAVNVCKAGPFRRSDNEGDSAGTKRQVKWIKYGGRIKRVE